MYVESVYVTDQVRSLVTRGGGECVKVDQQRNTDMHLAENMHTKESADTPRVINLKRELKTLNYK